MKNLILIVLILTGISCGSRKSEQTNSENIEPRLTDTIPGLAGKNQPIDPEPEKEVLPEIQIKPEPYIKWDDFEIINEGQAVIKKFDENHWDDIISKNYVDESRLGSLPMNLASGTYARFNGLELVYDSVYNYVLEMNYPAKKLYKVNKFTAEESLIMLSPDGLLSFLNLWKNKLYFINNQTIQYYNLETEKTGTVDTETEHTSCMAIADGRLFYSSCSEGIWVHDLETGKHKQLVSGEINWFWVSQSLLLYTDKQDKAFILDFQARKKYLTDMPFLKGTYFQDRLLFSPLPETHFDDDVFQDNEESDDNKRYPFVIQFGADSLVVLPHREQFLTLLSGKFIGLPHPEDYGNEKISVYTPPLGDNYWGFNFVEAKRNDVEGGRAIRCMNMFFSGNMLVSYETYSKSQILYYDVKSGISEPINDEIDFIKNDPRAIPSDFIISGDTLITGVDEKGPISVKIVKMDNRRVIATSGSFNRIIKPWSVPFWFKGFFDNKILYGLNGDDFNRFYSYYLHCLDKDDIKYFEMDNNDIDFFRDGFLYRPHLVETRIASFEPNF